MEGESKGFTHKDALLLHQSGDVAIDCNIGPGIAEAQQPQRRIVRNGIWSWGSLIWVPSICINLVLDDCVFVIDRVVSVKGRVVLAFQVPVKMVRAEVQVFREDCIGIVLRTSKQASGLIQTN